METTEKKKHKSGFALLKEKLAKAEAQIQTLESQLSSKKEELRRAKYELQTIIEQQSRKISQLTADLHRYETLRLNADAAHSKKEGEMLRAMGPIRRWWWNLHHLPTFKEDERWNETH